MNKILVKNIVILDILILLLLCTTCTQNKTQDIAYLPISTGSYEGQIFIPGTEKGYGKILAHVNGIIRNMVSSPNGSKLAGYFDSDPAQFEATPNENQGVFIVNSDGSNQKIIWLGNGSCIQEPTIPFPILWSQDSNNLIIDMTYDLGKFYTINLESLNCFETIGGLPSWAPSSREITYCTINQSGNNTIWVMDYYGGNKKVIAEGIVFYPAFILK